MRGKYSDNFCHLSYFIHRYSLFPSLINTLILHWNFIYPALVVYLDFFHFDEEFVYFSYSMVIKGIVCKKNIAHRRMTSKIEKPRLLILGGALEYQRVSNLLSSFDTLLQQVVIIYLSICSYLGI